MGRIYPFTDEEDKDLDILFIKNQGMKYGVAMSPIRIAFTIYIILLLVGGIIGFTVSGSIISIVMSSVFSILLLAAFLISLRWERLGLRTGLTLVIILTLFFAYRWFMTGLFFPAGVFTCLSAGICAALTYHLSNLPTALD